jgi:hypothetical protein
MVVVNDAFKKIRGRESLSVWGMFRVHFQRRSQFEKCVRGCESSIPRPLWFYSSRGLSVIHFRFSLVFVKVQNSIYQRVIFQSLSEQKNSVMQLSCS